MEKKKKTTNKTSKKTNAKKITAKKTAVKKTTNKKKKKKGFTLIELLAVIIILGILMIIAIPSVTKYISDSRKNSYIDTAKEIINGARNLVNEGKLEMYDKNTTYYMSSKCIRTENALSSPYGDFTQAYVGVIFDGKGYSYYWISVDDSGHGVKYITPFDKLDADDILSDIKESDILDTIKSVGIGSRKDIKVINCDSNDPDMQYHVDNTSYNASEEDGENANDDRIKCAPGTYLGKSSETCVNCPSGKYCPGGKYSYSDSDDQGIGICPVGSYSDGNSSNCTPCEGGTTTYFQGSSSGACYYYKCSNGFGAATWKTAYWTPNEVHDLCQINTCRTLPNATFTYNNNACIFTGTMYTSISSTISIGKNITSLYLYNKDVYFNTSELGTEAKYINIKTVVNNNIVTDFELCFRINGNGISVSGGRSGDYCLKVPFSGNTSTIYQYNVNILKTIFGTNNSRCSENSEGYTCIYNSSYLGWSFKVYKNGKIEVSHDDSNSDYTSVGNPYCYVDVNKIAGCPGHSCLSGDTIVEVYDEKKKRRYKKRLRDVTKDDLILCWDFGTGKIVFAKPLWIKKREISKKYYLLEFNDGSSLKIVGDHKLFDADRNKFVNAGADNELKIGSHVFNSEGKLVELVSWKMIEDEIDNYSVITDYHMNMFANGILTSCVFSNIYKVEDMKYIDEDVERLTNEDLDGIDNKYIVGLRLNEVPSNFRGSKEETISYVKKYVDNLISKENK